jgi:hypothetical protein
MQRLAEGHRTVDRFIDGFSRPTDAPTESHKSASAVAIPTENPRAKWYYPAQDGTAANMVLLALTGFYAGSSGPTPVAARGPGDDMPSDDDARALRS